MSDLAATNCGCDCNAGGGFGCGCGNILWPILILSCFGGCGGGCGGGCDHNGPGFCGNGCDWIWLVLLCSCCGNGRGFC